MNIEDVKKLKVGAKLLSPSNYGYTFVGRSSDGTQMVIEGDLTRSLFTVEEKDFQKYRANDFYVEGKVYKWAGRSYGARYNVTNVRVVGDKKYAWVEYMYNGQEAMMSTLSIEDFAEMEEA